MVSLSIGNNISNSDNGNEIGSNHPSANRTQEIASDSSLQQITNTNADNLSARAPNVDSAQSREAANDDSNALSQIEEGGNRFAALSVNEPDISAIKAAVLSQLGELSATDADSIEQILPFFESMIDTLSFLTTCHDPALQQAHLKQEFTSMLSNMLESECEDDIEAAATMSNLVLLTLLIDPENLRPTAPMMQPLSPEEKEIAITFSIGARERDDFENLREQIATLLPGHQIKPLPALDAADITVIEQTLAESDEGLLHRDLGKLNVNQEDDASIERLIALSSKGISGLFDREHHYENIAALAVKASPVLRAGLEDDLLSDEHINSTSILRAGSFGSCLTLVTGLTGNARDTFFDKVLNKVLSKSNDTFGETFLAKNQRKIADSWKKLNAPERQAIICTMEQLISECPRGDSESATQISAHQELTLRLKLCEAEADITEPSQPLLQEMARGIQNTLSECSEDTISIDHKNIRNVCDKLRANANPDTKAIGEMISNTLDETPDHMTMLREKMSTLRSALSVVEEQETKLNQVLNHPGLSEAPGFMVSELNNIKDSITTHKAKIERDLRFIEISMDLAGGGD